MDDWLMRYGAALQERLGSAEAGFAVGDAASTTLLELAKKVADATGDRTNAPLSCYLAGRFAEARAGTGVSTTEALDEAAEVATTQLGSKQREALFDNE
jgi:hypothetical protein